MKLAERHVAQVTGAIIGDKLNKAFLTTTNSDYQKCMDEITSELTKTGVDIKKFNKAQDLATYGSLTGIETHGAFQKKIMEAVSPKKKQELSGILIYNSEILNDKTTEDSKENRELLDEVLEIEKTKTK